MSNDDLDLCGEAFDHNLRLIGEGDGIRNYECLTCGAEIWEDDDEY